MQGLFRGNGDCILQLNRSIREDWRAKWHGVTYLPSPTKVPPNVVTQLESYAPISETKRAKDLVAVDGLVCTRMPDGSPAVLFSVRAPGAFGGKHWGYGGTTSAYGDIITFLEACVERESGVPFAAEVWVCNARTCAPELAQSTVNFCYAGYVPYEVVQSKKKTTADHREPRLFTLQDVFNIPRDQAHWFPTRAAMMALENMP